MLNTSTELEDQRSENCASEHRIQQGQEAQPSEQRPEKNSVKRRIDAKSKVEAEMRAGGMQGAEAGLSSVAPLQNGRLIPEQGLNEERDTKISLEAKSSARPQDHHTSASSSLLKTAKLHPGAQHSVSGVKYTRLVSV